MIRLLVGLGNPGQQYTRSRHNLGFRVLNNLAGQEKLDWLEKTKFTSSSFYNSGKKVWLLKPLTYMNLSGEAIAPFSRKKGITPEEILVIHDEVALPLGQLRLKRAGGAAGHNGIRSVMDSLGTDDFCRLRLGVGATPPGIDLSTYVLANFLAEEENVVAKMVEEATDSCRQILSAGFSKTMTSVNRRKPQD